MLELDNISEIIKVNRINQLCGMIELVSEGARTPVKVSKPGHLSSTQKTASSSAHF